MPPSNSGNPPAEAPPAAASAAEANFCVIGGGPLFRLVRRLRLTSDQMELLPRRILIAFVLAWVPVAILSAFEGHALGSSILLPFFNDIDVQARLLIALPLLLAAEVVAFQRMSVVLPQFFRRDMISDEELPKFDAAVASAHRLRDSTVAEILLLLFVYVFGVNYLWKTHMALSGPTWFGIPEATGRRLTAAGWWYALVSLPIWQFLLVRWYYRLAIWGRLLWQISRVKLKLVPTHPDHCGGLGFLAAGIRGFKLLLVVHGTMVGGTIANRIFFRGGRLVDYKMEVGVYAAIMLALILGPTLAFCPALARLKRRGLTEYGAFAHDYVRDFDRKWVHGSPSEKGPLGSSDIQSLADLGNSYDLVRKMQIVPFNRSLVMELLVSAVLPIAPLMLTVIPLETMVSSVVKMIF